MKPIIAISKAELQRHPHADKMLSTHAGKVTETDTLNIYIVHDSIAFLELFCYLRDSEILFTYGNDEEINTIVSTISSRPKWSDH